MIILILALLLPIIESKVINITKTDFYKEPIHIYRLEDGDGISFVKDDKEYIVSVDEIGKTSVRLKSFGYKDDDTKEIFYTNINKAYTNKIDFEKDNIYDMKVSLIDIKDNRTKAELLFEALNEPKTDKDNTTTKDYNLKAGLLITALIVVVGLLIYLILRKK